MSDERPPDLLESVERWNHWCIEEANRHAGLSPGRPPIDPVAALAANCRASQLLEVQRWWAVAAARAGGATWEEIADVLGTSSDTARFQYGSHQAQRPLEAVVS